MLPQYIKVHGYRSYIDEYIDFTSFGNTFVVIGENGAGKSSIIEMITTALYYRNTCTDNKGAGMESLINTNCDYFEIEFCFVMNNVEYLIIAKKVRDAGRELEFYIDGVNQGEKILETQKKINSVIKLDYDTFLDTVCIGQGESSRFMQKSPNERKNTFIQILDLKRYELYEKEAKERKKNYKSNIDNFELEIKNLTFQNINEDQIKKQLLEYKNSLNESKTTIKKLEKELKEVIIEKAKYDSYKQQSESILSSRKNLEQNINKCETQLLTLNSNVKDYKNKINEINFDEEIKLLENKIESETFNKNELNSNIVELNTKNSILTSNVKKIKNSYKQLNDYGKSICDFCGNDISESHKELHLSELKNEGKKILDEIKDNENVIVNIKEKIIKLNATISDFLSLKKEKQNNKQLNDKYKNALNEITGKINIYRDMILEYKQQYEENIKIDICEVEDKTFNDNELQNEINLKKGKLETVNKSITILDENIKNIELNKEKLIKLNKDLKSTKEIYGDINDLCSTFGKSGIQANIINNDLPEIESEINKVLNLLCGGTITVSFITEKETGKSKSKKTIDTLDIFVNDLYGSRKYETYSGGEKFRVDFACHVGLAKFLAKRSGATIDFFIVDEGLGSQDNTAKQQFIESINQLNKIFKQIMCITHIQELQDSFDSKVLIEKDQINGSKVEIII